MLSDMNDELSSLLDRKLTCPACNKETNFKESTLKDSFLFNVGKQQIDALSRMDLDHLRRYQEFAGDVHQMDSARTRYHTFLWACNECIQNGVAQKPDYSKQEFGMGGVVSAYVDVLYCCSTCADEFYFYASEQKQWFEDFKFNIDSRPKACLTCRRQRRAERSTQKQF